MRPPLEKDVLADESEPGSELDGRILEEGLEIVGGDVFGGLDLVLADLQVDVGLDEEDIVDWEKMMLVWMERERETGGLRYGVRKGVGDVLSCSPHSPLLGAL